MRKQLISTDAFARGEAALPRLVGGVDISFSEQPGEEDVACACLVVLDAANLSIVYQKCELVRLELPYISGFLGFREVPSLAALLEELREQRLELFPDILLTDGNGVLHHRGFGVACHLGLVANVPTVGCAKTLLEIDGLSKSRLGNIDRAGDTVELKGDSGRIWGVAMRTTAKSTNPIFVSCGHRVSLPSAVAIVGAACRHRVPEPIRMADLISRDYLRRLRDGAIEAPAWLEQLRFEASCRRQSIADDQSRAGQ